MEPQSSTNPAPTDEQRPTSASVNPVPPPSQAKAVAMTRGGERPQGEDVLQETYEPLAGPAAEDDAR